MKRLLALLLISGVAGAATMEPDGRIVLTAEECEACAKEGGCLVVTRRLLAQVLAALEKPAQCGRDAVLIVGRPRGG